MSEHTPTPWVHGSWGGQCHIKHRHNGTNCVYDPVFNAGMTEISGPNREIVIGSDYDGLVAKPEDIAFIVKAVNNHDKLANALRESRAALIAFKDAVEASQKMNGREYVGLGIQINNAIGHAWNALAAVGTVGDRS